MVRIESGPQEIIQEISAMERGGMPKPGEQARSAFDDVVPDAPAVSKRPMFGNQAAFVNGNMFAGLFGDGLFVRLPDDRLQRLLEGGGSPFEPMPGRPMRGYGFLPAGWMGDIATAQAWAAEAREFASALPPKQPKAKAAPKRRGGG